MVFIAARPFLVQVGIVTGSRPTPTNTVTPGRVRLFEPSNRPGVRHGEKSATAWGSCAVSGTLGQRHADLLELCLYCARDRWDGPTGEISLLVDPALVRKGMSDARHSGGRIEGWLKDLVSATVTIENFSTGLNAHGPLIEKFEKTSKKYPNPLPDTQGRCFWILRLGCPLVVLLEDDVPCWYDPRPIARLEHGIGKAVVRHLLTHSDLRNKRNDVDRLIKTVAGDVSAGQVRKFRHLLRKEAGALREIGFVLEGGFIKRVKGKTASEQPSRASFRDQRLAIGHE